jgi:GNAT superfamily N-acetyltransferase
MPIVYRHYQVGDDHDLAHLYNVAFQMNGAGFVRTPIGWNWRYVQSPSFEPEMIQIAEDKENHRIIGAIHVNLVEKVRINGKEYIFGDINDVTCHPDYTKKGVATKLLKMAIDFMQKMNCDFSILTADAKGIARKKIYLPHGFEDISRVNMLFNFPNIFRLIRDFPGFMIFTPVLFTISYLPRFIIRLLTRKNPFFKDINYEISHNKKHFEYTHARNKIMSRYYSGFPMYNAERLKWARINTPSKRHHPTYVIMRKKSRVIGGAIFTRKNIYSFKHGIKIRMAIIHEIFLDKKRFKNELNLLYGYKYLIDKILKAATKRYISFVLYPSNEDDIDVINALKTMKFLKFSSAMIMIKSLKEDFKKLNAKKPLFLPTYISLGFP